MSILGWALGALVPGGAVIAAVLKFGAGAVLGKISDVLTGIWSALQTAAGWLFKNPAVMAAVAVACFALAVLQWQDARHWKKADGNDLKGRQAAEKIVAAVKVEVDRGVGQNTRADQAPIWIRRFVDNVNLLSGALDRQNAALRAEGTDADKAKADTHRLAQPTADQVGRDRVRKALESPTRVDGADTDWGRL
ncbi:MAG TPA: hypothetical protein VFW19_10545 [Allosphingosinicella sp.]|nr:hypothetical protein [Allosphingosinicella sp.]